MGWLRQLWRSRYVRLLEEENARLRVENRAFLNSLLGTAGFASIESSEPATPVEYSRLRKRSWPQIQRMKEEQTRQ